MKYCKNCKINVDADRNYCPLCFRELKTINEESVGEYPFMERRKNEHVTQSTHLLLKIFLFLSVSIISVCTLVNLLINPETLWCLLVGFSLIYVWILVAHTILSRRGVFEKIFMQLVGVMLILWACEILSLNKEHWLHIRQPTRFPFLVRKVLDVLRFLVMHLIREWEMHYENGK